MRSESGETAFMKKRLFNPDSCGREAPVATAASTFFSRRRFEMKALLICVAALLFSLPSAAVSQQGPDTGSVRLSSPEDIWNKALKLLDENGSEDKAAVLFQSLYDAFPDSSKSEEALWRAAQLKKRLALQADDPDWEEVLYLYRTFVTAFPKSQYAPQAYFEVGCTNQKMNLYREALTYFKLFQKRYPGSALLPQVKYRQALVMLEIGKADDAEKILHSLADTEDQTLRIAVSIALGDSLSRKNRWGDSLEKYQQVLKESPKYFFDDPEFLRKLGVVHCRMQDEQACRERLYYFLNLVEGVGGRAEALFELAESHRRKNEEGLALRLYEMILDPDSNAGAFADFAELRKAQYRDALTETEPGVRKAGDLNDPAEDRPFLDVIDRHHDHPLVADAFYSLFVRYRFRGNLEQSIEAGRSFLRKAQPGSPAVDDQVKDVLDYLGTNMLAAGEHEKLYELYRAEHDLVNAVQSGTFIYHVGRALETLGLLNEAAAVYYRALAFPLTEAEKAALYFQRAHVYMVNNDLASAERLLAYLQEIYTDKPEAEMVYFLSGQFAELKKRPEEAIQIYEQIKPPLAYEENKSRYAEATLKILFDRGKYSVFLQQAAIYGKHEWLSADVLQDWYVKAASAAIGASGGQYAEELYRSAVAAGMPPETSSAQQAHLGLGNIYYDAKEFVKSRDHFQLAQKGTDGLAARLAAQRLQQIEISRALSTMRTVLEP